MSYQCTHWDCNAIVDRPGQRCGKHEEKKPEEEKTAKIKKIFFYTGTALVDPDAEYGCPFHPDQKDLDERGLCKAICNQSYVQVYQCPVHNKKVTTNPEDQCEEVCGQETKPTKYVCRDYHGENEKEHEGRCEEECGRICEYFGDYYACSRHREQRFDKKPPDEWKCQIKCGQKLTPTKYLCEHHKKVGPFKDPQKCKAYCGKLMNQPANGYSCPNHLQNRFDAQEGLCQETCKHPKVPLETSLGYRRNVSVFMDFVGSKVDKGKEWGLCVNVARDPKTFSGTTGRDTTLHAGPRRFRYYAPKEIWDSKTKVDDYLKDYKVLKGKSEVLVKTTSLLKNRTACILLGWPDRYELSWGGKKKELDNCSSRCFAGNLNTLQSWLSSAVPNQKVFVVCDCNSFHNSAYLFGLLALSKFVKPVTQIKKLNLRKTSVRGKKDNLAQHWVPPAVLILNFDRHNDDQCTKGMAYSDGWGEALLRNFNCGAYLAIGVPDYGSIHIRVKIPKKDNEYEWQQTKAEDLDDLKEKIKEVREELAKKAEKTSETKEMGEDTAPPPPGIGPPPDIGSPRTDKKGKEKKEEKNNKFEDANKWKKLWEELQKLMNHYTKKRVTFKYYYITIDRDCMKDNHNQWGDDYEKKEKDRSFFKDQDHIGKAVEAIRTSLNSATLTGMDITGLPEVTTVPGTIKRLVNVKKKKGCEDPKCPNPECVECRTEIMTKLGEEINFWYGKFEGWISEQEKKKEKV